MNIFKVLANGDGRINEPNVSAFLGYLLDPYQDHGLAFEFLKRFLKQLNINDFKTEKYDYEIILEQAFKDENGHTSIEGNSKQNKKEIVDIVILCIENNRGILKEMVTRSILESPLKLHKVFLIENKVTPKSIIKDQLKSQYEKFIKQNKETINDNQVYSVFLTPDDSKFANEFTNFNSQQKTHLKWIYEEEKPNEEDIESENYDSISIYKILKDIIYDEAVGKIEGINEYTKHTLKSFTKFIENDFKSELKEKKERKNDGAFTENHKELNETYRIYEKLEKLGEKLNLKFHNEHYTFKVDMAKPKDPTLLIIIPDFAIHLGAGFKPRNRVNIVLSVIKGEPKSKEKLNNLAFKNNLVVKKPNTNEPYLRIPTIPNKIDLNDDEIIYKYILEMISFINNNS